jgi:alpha-amylase
MGKVYFLFGIHNHQPVGNFFSVFEEAYKQCYFPFISILNEFPKIKFSIHNSGSLYDWILEYKKDYIQILKKMVQRGQAEIISGGYYEPILPLITEEDRKGQITLMNKFIEKEFKVKPQGIWIAERVWEPYLARVINVCNLKYTFLDDTHFRYAGLKDKEFFGYYITEEEGKTAYIFPISKTLRYKIPFSLPEEAIKIINGFAKNEDVLVTLFDDGEKFGLWPHTYEWVYKKEWLKKFLSLLENSSIETITPSEAIKKFSPQGIVYLPAASYEEMNEWVLEPEVYFTYEKLKNFLEESGKLEEFKDFIRGGVFRNFYRKYSRLNYMHKRMLFLSKKINRYSDFKKDRKIFINLWKAQANCGYWHGIFGGFYLSHIRGAIYEHLIRAESLLDKKYIKKDLIFEEEDIDLDGYKEVILKNKSIICSFSKRGGTLLELSLKKHNFNLLNTITRREESYHKKIKENIVKDNKITTIHDIISHKDKDLKEYLVYDKYERVSLIDHLLKKDINLDDFNFQRGVNTLSNQIYSLSINHTDKKIFLNYFYKNEGLEFLKRIAFSTSNELNILYEFKKNDILNTHNFGIEFNLSFVSLKDIFNKREDKEIPLNQPYLWGVLDSFVIVDYHKKIILEFKHKKAEIFTFPLYSVSSSESGFEKVYQQIVILFAVKNKESNFRISFRIRELD